MSLRRKVEISTREGSNSGWRIARQVIEQLCAANLTRLRRCDACHGAIGVNTVILRESVGNARRYEGYLIS